MKSISICLLTCTCLIVFKAYSQDTINWSPTYKLKWEDFQGVPDSTTEYGAVSTIPIKYSTRYTEKDFIFYVYCFFMKKKSWVRIYTNEELIHEQGHFNIGEVFARKLRMAFEEYKFNPVTVKQDAKKIFNQIKLERTAMDSLYDKETDFHRNDANQAIWNKKIANLLSNK